MKAVTGEPNLIGRRLTGAMLHALLVNAVLAPIMIAVVGGFSTVGGSGALQVMLATVALLALLNLALGRWPPYVAFFEPKDGSFFSFLAQSLFDDALTSREKLRFVLQSAWGRIWLALDLGWLALTAAAIAWD